MKIIYIGRPVMNSNGDITFPIKRELVKEINVNTRYSVVMEIQNITDEISTKYGGIMKFCVRTG